MSKMNIKLMINGKEHQISAAADETLLNTLRETLDLGGARESCGIGVCGACSILVDGQVMSSCLLLTSQVEGKNITTIEGLADGKKLHAVQQAYVDHAGFQCAYCTSGFILSTVALLDEYKKPDDDQIREYLSGNLCRCGSYVNILEAVRSID